MAPTSPRVHGINLDPPTRCEHYHGPTDIIAIKMKCCGVYYVATEVWPENEWSQKAILCGACGLELTIRQFMESEFRCPACRSQCNAGCRNHYHLYFEVLGSS